MNLHSVVETASNLDEEWLAWADGVDNQISVAICIIPRMVLLWGYSSGGAARMGQPFGIDLAVVWEQWPSRGWMERGLGPKLGREPATGFADNERFMSDWRDGERVE